MREPAKSSKVNQADQSVGGGGLHGSISRRQFLIAATSLVGMISAPAFARQPGFWELPRRLRLERKLPSGRIEFVNEVYWADGEIVQSGYHQICRLLRDVYFDEAAEMNFVTLDIIRGIQGCLEQNGVGAALQIHSGYRDPRTNANTEGASRTSLHMAGKAIDLSIPGVGANRIAAFGLFLAGGGVGYYPGRDFTHVDCGNLRFWRG